MSQYGATRLRYSAATRQQRAMTRPVIRSGPRNDMTGHDHDTVGHRRNTAGEGATTRRNARVACAQPRPWVCALCTRPSFDSVPYSELLFGSLFMNTVHEVFKKNKNNK